MIINAENIEIASIYASENGAGSRFIINEIDTVQKGIVFKDNTYK